MSEFIWFHENDMRFRGIMEILPAPACSQQFFLIFLLQCQSHSPGSDTKIYIVMKMNIRIRINLIKSSYFHLVRTSIKNKITVSESAIKQSSVFQAFPLFNM